MSTRASHLLFVLPTHLVPTPLPPLVLVRLLTLSGSTWLFYLSPPTFFLLSPTSVRFVHSLPTFILYFIFCSFSLSLLAASPRVFHSLTPTRIVRFFQMTSAEIFAPHLGQPEPAKKGLLTGFSFPWKVRDGEVRHVSCACVCFDRFSCVHTLSLIRTFLPCSTATPLLFLFLLHCSY
jgi:hypothetical protein